MGIDPSKVGYLEEIRKSSGKLLSFYQNFMGDKFTTKFEPPLGYRSI
jgi:hypothetical protein